MGSGKLTVKEAKERFLEISSSVKIDIENAKRIIERESFAMKKVSD